MDKNDLYVLPKKGKQELSRVAFIVYSIISDVLCVVLMNLITFWIFGVDVGYFPVELVLILADIFHVSGCVYYLHKHDFAYGRRYERYQIVNAVIYGAQNYLRVLLVVLVICIMVIPIYYISALFVFTLTLFFVKRRLF